MTQQDSSIIRSYLNVQLALKLSIEDFKESVNDFNTTYNTNYTVRLRNVNGQGLMGTADVKDNRINITVKGAKYINNQYTGGIIVSYTFG